MSTQNEKKKFFIPDEKKSSCKISIGQKSLSQKSLMAKKPPAKNLPKTLSKNLKKIFYNQPKIFYEQKP